jgi:hypothetical protein
MASSTASSTCAAANPAAVAAHRLALVSLYWYGYHWDYRQRTRSFYVGKTLPAGVELIPGADQAAPPITAVEGGDAQA